MSNYEQEYLKLCKKIIDEGGYTGDRTGTGTYSIFGGMMKHDMGLGFPILTTKKVNLNLVAGELLFLLGGSCDRRVLQEKSYGEYNEDKHDIWKLDCIKASELKENQFNGLNLGEMYPEYWRMLWNPEWNSAISIDKRYPKSSYVKPTFPEHTGTFVTDAVSSQGLPLRVYDKVYSKKDNRSLCTIQFKDTGFVVKNVIWKSSGIFQVRDRYQPYVASVGYLGDVVPSYESRLYNMWRSMVLRCYDKNNESYNRYGGKGVYVHKSWHSFSEFYKDVFTIPNFQKWYCNVGKWSLDKDYLNGSVYSKDTCMFLPKELNSKLTGMAIKNKEGRVFFSLSDAEVYEGTSVRGSLERLEAKGYSTLQTDLGDTLIRPKLFTDQIANLISSILKVKAGDYVDSRRLCVSSWNPNHEVNAVLAACHDSFQCIVRDGKLHLRFSCRSNDFFLGNPYNFTSYALLLHILAKLARLEVGELLYFGTDVHLYSNHLDQIKEQLSREPRELPKLILPEFNNLEELLQLTGKDFVLEGYDPHSFIKAPQAS